MDGDIVFAAATWNPGRGNVDNASLNVVVPAFFTSIERCSHLGETGKEEHKGAWDNTPEALIPYQPDLGSIYWSGGVSFSGRMSRIIYFRLTKEPGVFHNFPVQSHHHSTGAGQA
ncbi:MAG: hypothetical protein ABWY83_06575, partial [Actinomycetota bacterium]